MEQAKTKLTMESEWVYRWYVYTDQGRKISWQPTAEAARAMSESKGLVVDRVEPAPPSV